MKFVRKRTAILISGRGSNMTALIAAAANPDYPAEIVGVLSDKVNAAGLGIAAALWLLGRARHRRAARIGFSAAALAFSLAAGLAGAVLVFLWGCTEHRAAWRNENLLLLDPLCLALLPAWWRAMREDWRPSRTARWLAGLVLAAAGFAVFSKVLPWFVQANVHWIALIVPIHLVLAATLWRQPRAAR